MTAWMVVTVVSKSLTSVLIETFMTDWSRTITNCAVASATSGHHRFIPRSRHRQTRTARALAQTCRFRPRRESHGADEPPGGLTSTLTVARSAPRRRLPGRRRFAGVSTVAAVVDPLDPAVQTVEEELGVELAAGECGDVLDGVPQQRV